MATPFHAERTASPVPRRHLGFNTAVGHIGSLGRLRDRKGNLRLPFGRLQSQRIDALVSQALSVRLPHTPAANDHNTVRKHGRTLEIRSAEACGTIYGFEIIKDGGVQQFTPSSIALDQLLHHGARYLGQSLSLHYPANTVGRWVE